ncbi:Pre-mRNA-processing ATP-dependent RNA helicase PRP5 [Scheffersomyces amazonensis]|uniref:Pre-mRNA-processing ATP-dependent RNA helicase PRP5 n=1 Tax=Scheffersomyces amazonensis TaxID=1078765 RepID=UPI00315CBE96
MSMNSKDTNHSQIKENMPGNRGQTNESNHTNNTGNEELTKAEKLRRRREQLAQWKEKKEQEKTDSNSNSNSNSNKSSKLEEWKRRKALENEKLNATSKAKQSSPQSHLKISGIKKLKPKSVATITTSNIKRSVLDDDEIEDIQPKFKKPNLDIDLQSINYNNNINGNSKDNDEPDELDQFIKSLDKKNDETQLVRTTSETQENDNVSEKEEEEDDEENDDELQQKLLSAKLLKLQNKEKALEAVDYSNQEFSFIRKNFYTEPYELKQLSIEDVEALRFELDGIRVHGLNIPKPITKWSHLSLPSVYNEIITNKLHYTTPTSIQSQALPTIMSGRDLIGVAKTGSGKTLSFVLPMLRHIQDQDPLSKDDGPIGLVLTPTRELALQIYKELQNFVKRLELKVSCCYGGSPIENQIADLKKGVEIIVGTPGRVIDLLAANGGRVTNLRRVTYLVLDEADRMFDMGFEPQVSKIFTQIRPDRQTVLFSATFPRKMELLAKKILNNPIEIIVGGISVVASEVKQLVELFEGDENEINENKFIKLTEELKKFQSSDPQGKVLIFVEKQSFADDLLVRLLSENFPCLTIHGGKDQLDRKHAIKDFSSKTSGLNILIATSIAARGLDVKGLNLVINYDAPNHIEDYVHRVGRTGRAGAKGTALTFVSSNQERCITDLVKAMRLSKVPDSDIPTKLIEISDTFLANVKRGKAKYHFGFGGRGLDNLQQIRESNLAIQRKEFNIEEPEENRKENELSMEGTPTPESKIHDSKLPDFTIIEGGAPETAGPDRGNFHSRITINDLPQKARLTVLNRDSLSKIIETTSAAITNKGQYYPPGTKIPTPTIKKGKEISAPPKLYLLVEGLTEQSVHEANRLLRSKMIEGLELAAKDENMAPIGKYKV